MKKKKLWVKLLVLAVLLVVGTGAGFFAVLAVSLGGPVALQQVTPWLAGAFWLTVALTCSGLLTKKWDRRLWLAVLCVAACSGVWLGRAAYIERIPTVKDRELILSDYKPFGQGTPAAALDGPSTLRFDGETARSLRLDGATALYPVYAAFVQAVYPEGEYPLREYPVTGSARWEPGLVACSGTDDAYKRLRLGETDIIFAAEPSQEQIHLARSLGMELYLTPIGREAFVFFVNSRNPVTGLTVEEIQGIYSGRITDWRQVGGENRAILPYQRRANSGSQSALLRLMDGLPLIPPTEELVAGSMGGIIEQVADYRNFRNAIGFSFRFYATEMVQNGGIRLLALNGVEPTKETIRDGSYPISDQFYAVTAGPIGEAPPWESNPDMAAFLEWMTSPQGQLLVERSGYVPVK